MSLQLFNVGDGGGNPNVRSDSLIRVQVWSAIAYGSRGLYYYCPSTRHLISQTRLLTLLPLRVRLGKRDMEREHAGDGWRWVANAKLRGGESHQCRRSAVGHGAAPGAARWGDQAALTPQQGQVDPAHSGSAGGGDGR